MTIIILWHAIFCPSKFAEFSGGFGGGARGTPPWAPKFFQFQPVFGKIWQNRMLAPPWEILDPPLELFISVKVLTLQNYCKGFK